MAFRIDQAGLAAGTPGRARTDGLATGALVTLTNTSGGTTTFRLLWVPVGDTTAVASLAPTGPGSDVWTFSPTPSRPGTYRIQLIRNLGQPGEVREERVFRVRTPNKGLIIPAFNEAADPLGSLLNNGPAVVEASADNALDYAGALAALDYAGWFRAKHELIMAADVAGLSAIPRLSRTLYVDPLTSVVTRTGSIDTPLNSLNEAHTLINAAAANISWVVILQAGQTYSSSTAFPTGRHVTYTTSQQFQVQGEAITDTRISLTISTVATGFNLCFRGLNVLASNFNGTGRIVARDCTLASFNRNGGTAGAAVIYAANCRIAGLAASGADNAFSLEAVDCEFYGLALNTYRLRAVGCVFGNTPTIETRVTSEILSSKFTTSSPVLQTNTSTAATLFLDASSRASADAAGCTISHENSGSGNARVGVADLLRYRFRAEDFLVTNTAAWHTNSAAEVAAHPTVPFQVVNFDPTTIEGVGLTFAIPAGKTMVTFEFWYTGAGAEVGAIAYALDMTFKRMAAGGGVISAAWSTPVTIALLPTVSSDTYWVRYRVRVALATIGMTDRSLQLVQMRRNTGHASDNINGDLTLREMIIELT